MIQFYLPQISYINVQCLLYSSAMRKWSTMVRAAYWKRKGDYCRLIAPEQLFLNEVIIPEPTHN